MTPPHGSRSRFHGAHRAAFCLVLGTLASMLVGTSTSRAQILYSDDFDDGSLSEYGQVGGSWTTVTESGSGRVLRHTGNADTILYALSESFNGSYQLRAEIWNEDNDAAGVAFRVDTGNADNFYSCSATADSAFQAGIWRHVNDVADTPTTPLAGTSWNYARSRWYTVTITIDQTANTIRCQWESTESGVELDVTAADPDPPSAGSVGIWLSSQDNFKGDLLEVSSLGPPDTMDPEVTVTSPTTATNTSDFDIIFTAIDDIGVDACSYELDGGASTPLPGCSNTTLTSVSLGAHTLQVFATDTSGNTGSSPLIPFTITDDVSPPEWNPVPVNQMLLEGESLSYHVNAVDNDSVIYSVSGVGGFSMDPSSGLLTSGALMAGVYPLTVTAQDAAPIPNTINANITVTVTATPPPPPPPPPASFYDNFDDGDLSEYGQRGGNWSTVSEPDKGLVLRQTTNNHTILYAMSESFSGSYRVKAEIWNEDNDAAGVAFRVNTADADNFYSCSATSDNGFQAGIVQHVNRLRGTPTRTLAGTSWNYVRSRWYTVTITIDQTANTIHCQWESAESGVELDVMANVDPDPSASGSIGIWLSSEDNFKGDLLEVSSLGPPDTTDPEVTLTSPTTATNTSDFDITYSATDDVGVDACSYELDGGTSTPLPGCTGTTLTSVSMGAHTLQVSATDTSGNTGSSPLIAFNITNDVSPPEWNSGPVDQMLLEGESLSYQVHAVDNDSVIYSVSGAGGFSIDAAGWLTSAPLAVGVYPLTVTAEDMASNAISANITVTVTAVPPPPPPPPPASFYDNFDDGDLSEYGQIGGNWSPVGESGRGMVLRQTTNDHTILYAMSESFSGSYQVKAEIWNEDNDAAGVAFRVDTSDADNFYSCSATSDSGFQAGLSQHVNDLNGTPTRSLAGVSWNYVRSRWYTVTITIDQTANTIRCQWESAESGVELDVMANVDPDPSASGSIGIWLSSEDNFKGDLLEVSPLGPPDTTPPEITVTSPTTATNTSTFDLTYDATDDVAVTDCWYELDGGASTVLPNCQDTVVTSLSLEPHVLEVFASDPSGNTASVSIAFTVGTDNSPPEWNTVPVNQPVLEGELLSYPVDAVDNVAIDFYSVDDTTNFSIGPTTGLLVSNTTLALGSYPVTIYVQDTNGNVAMASITVTVVSANVPPAGFTVAFIGDQGSGSDAQSVLELIRNESADMVMHQGDFDYNDDPNGWDQLITDVLGANFPYFASIGNHDAASWTGYQQKLLERLARVPDASCTGDYGVNSACTFNGLFFVLSGVGERGSGHATYINQQMALTDSLWRICSWHKNMQAMQIGGKGDSTGWEVYEECRMAGAIIATAHEHSYERTKTLISMQNQTIDPAWPLPNEVRIAPGSTIAFVSGLGGASIRDQERCLPTTYPYGCNGEWASIYASNQGANHGALFCSFNFNGQPNKANCYFKDVDGNVPDQFDITSFHTPVP